MPLSEHEQRLLEQMEQALYAEDPKLASALRHGSSRPISGKRILLGGVGLVAGLAVLVAGVATANVFLGVIGFLLMLGGVMVIASAMRPQQADGDGAQNITTAPKAASAKPAKSSSGFMSRVEDRWRKRRETDGY